MCSMILHREILVEDSRWQIWNIGRHSWRKRSRLTACIWNTGKHLFCAKHETAEEG